MFLVGVTQIIPGVFLVDGTIPAQAKGDMWPVAA